MTMRPLHDRILVKRMEEQEDIQGGIVIPDTAKEKPQEGEVVAVGDGKILDNGQKLTMSLKAGDRILLGEIRWNRGQAGRRRVPAHAGRRGAGRFDREEDQSPSLIATAQDETIQTKEGQGYGCKRDYPG